MTTVAGISGPISNALSAQTVALPASPPPAASSSAASQSSAQPLIPHLTSRLVDDPVSGIVITQYLNIQGQIVSQVPPSAVVAYLQDGLTSDGFVKSQPRQTAVA
jgi:hypothetical protein